MAKDTVEKIMKLVGIPRLTSENYRIAYFRMLRYYFARKEQKPDLDIHDFREGIGTKVDTKEIYHGDFCVMIEMLKNHGGKNGN